MVKKLNGKSYEVDGIIFTGEEGNLIMEFKVGNMVHKFKINKDNAMEMAKVLSLLFLSNHDSRN